MYIYVEYTMHRNFALKFIYYNKYKLGASVCTFSHFS